MVGVLVGWLVFFANLSQTNDYDGTLSKITQLCNQRERASEHGHVTPIP